MDKTVVELFAGVGGFRVGLSKASVDWDFLWANQWEPSRKAQDAYDCYASHFGTERHSNMDISLVDKNSIPDHNLLVGGFPCQDYSVASTGAKGIEGKKGVLWWSIYETVLAKQPSFILLENVDRLLKSPASQRGRDFSIILGCLNDLGYSVEWRVINAAEYGYPQKRRRVFIFAYRDTTRYAAEKSEIAMEKIVLEEGFFQKVFKANKIDGKSLDETYEFKYKDIVDISNNIGFEFYNAGYMSRNRIYTAKLFPFCEDGRDFMKLRDVLQGGVDSRFYLNGELEKWEYMKGSKRIERTHKDGHKYVFSEGAIPFPDNLDSPGRTMLTSEATNNRSTHVVMDPETEMLRKLTPVECERLNGFPDDWTNTGMSERFRYFCMGNALVVNLVTDMGKALGRIFERED